MKAMKSFVISLSNAEIRRKHILNEFQQQHIDFEFFDAITPKDINETQTTLGLSNYTTTLHPNEIGCLFSHMMLWKRAVDENLDYIAIFEDDIYLGKKSDVFLTQTDWIPEQCDIIKLEMIKRKIFISLNEQQISLPDQRKLWVLAEQHMGCGGYILSQHMAKCLWDFVVNSGVLIPVDHIVFREYSQSYGDKIYQIAPAVCIQDTILTKGKTRFPSSLEDVRNERKGEIKVKQKLSLNAKINRELKRLFLDVQRFLHEQLQVFKGKKVKTLRFK